VYDDRVYEGKGFPGSELYQSDFTWDPGVPGPKYDPEHAKQLVAEAKAAGWDGKVRVNAANDPAGKAVALATESMLRAVGMDVQVDTTKDTSGHIAQVSVARDFDIANFGVNVTPDDGGVLLLSTYLSTNPGNRVGFKNAQFDKGIQEALVAKTDDEKRAAYKDIAQGVTDGLPFYIFGAPEEFVAFPPDVHGVTGGARTAAYLGKAWIEK
jgi:peptide/nickel transport system substrate-binding protein